MIKIRILFAGCVEYSKVLLKKLIHLKDEVIGVITKEKLDFNSDFYDLSDMCILSHEVIGIPYTDDAKELKRTLFKGYE